MDKPTVRKEMIKKRLELDVFSYMSKSNLILSYLENMKCFKQAKTIGIYISMKQEVNTIDFINKWCNNKAICVPRVTGKSIEFFHIHSLEEVKEGTFGVLEPVSNQQVSPSEIDLLVIPMLAYDDNYHRIGYGGGYYDRYLQEYYGSKVGIAFSFQKIAFIDIEEHDISLDVILNENSSTII